MRIRGITCTGAAFLAAAVIVLLSALLAAQSARPTEFPKPQVVDMGAYRVSAPPGKGWKISQDKESGQVTFRQIKGTGLLDALVPFSQARGTFITVTPVFFDSWKWGISEEAAEDAVINQAFNRGLSGTVPDDAVEKGEVVLKDKKLRFRKYQTSYWDQSQGTNYVADNLDYLYFPPTFRKSHIAVMFSSQFTRTTNWELFKNPGQGPVAAVIDSFEVVDALKTVPGPEGDLLRAAAAGDLEAARKAIDMGAKANVTASQMNALSAAAYYGHREVVDLLLGQGVEINKADDEAGITPLIAAISGGEPEVADFLVQRGADVNLQTKRGLSALMWAADIEHPGLVSSLIGRGADVNAKSAEGLTALMISAGKTGTTEIAQLLITAGADVNIQKNDGKNALMLAINKKNPEMARMLLEKNADVNLKTQQGWTALMSAALRGDPDIVESIIHRGADLNSVTNENRGTALLAALTAGNPKNAEVLIGAGADINLKLKDGTTALMMASDGGQAAIVKLLIEKGADVNAKTAKNQTALKMAKKKKHADIVSMLQAAGAKG